MRNVERRGREEEIKKQKTKTITKQRKQIDR
jgi:hypothetical protein